MGISFFLSASGVIPTSSNVYDIGEIGPQTSLKEKTSANMPPGAFNPAIYVTSAVWSWLVPVGTALYLLESDISKLATSGRDMLAAFALGAAGSVVGMLAAWHVVSGPSTMGPEGWKIAAALTASYVSCPLVLFHQSTHHSCVATAFVSMSPASAQRVPRPQCAQHSV